MAAWVRVQATRCARKAHVCESCGRTIAVGQPLVHVVWSAGRERGTEKFCPRCWSLYDRVASWWRDVTGEVLAWSLTWEAWLEMCESA